MVRVGQEMDRAPGAPPSSLEAMIVCNGGLQLRDTPLWFDARAPRGMCFISNGSVRAVPRHARMLATEITADLLRARTALGGRRRRAEPAPVLAVPYRQQFTLGLLTLELIPAGYLPGSASLLVQYLGRTVLYAGQIGSGSGSLVGPPETRPCDLLVVPCHDAEHARSALPPTKQVQRSLIAFVRRTLAAGETPVLLCPPVGLAQELVSLFWSEGIGARLHREIHAACCVYAKHAVASFDSLPLRRYDPRCGIERGEEVIIWPVRLSSSPALCRLDNVRRALVSPRAITQTVLGTTGCDACFALPDLAGHAAMVDYIRACKARHVVLVGSGSGDLAARLDGLGMSVSRLSPQQQLELFGYVP